MLNHGINAINKNYEILVVVVLTNLKAHSGTSVCKLHCCMLSGGHNSSAAFLLLTEMLS